MEDKSVEELNNKDVYDLFKDICCHIDYLNNSIIEEEEDTNEDVKI